MRRRGPNSFKKSVEKKVESINISPKTELPEFELYDKLVLSINNKPIESYVINSICSTIGRYLSLEHREMLFLIIYHHYQLHNNKSKKMCPYNGNIYPRGKGASFNMNYFPEDLLHIIIRYIGIASGIEDF